MQKNIQKEIIKRNIKELSKLLLVTLLIKTINIDFRVSNFTFLLTSELYAIEEFIVSFKIYFRAIDIDVRKDEENLSSFFITRMLLKFYF